MNAAGILMHVFAPFNSAPGSGIANLYLSPALAERSALHRAEEPVCPSIISMWLKAILKPA